MSGRSLGLRRRERRRRLLCLKTKQSQAKQKTNHKQLSACLYWPDLPALSWLDLIDNNKLSAPKVAIMLICFTSWQLFLRVCVSARATPLRSCWRVELRTSAWPNNLVHLGQVRTGELGGLADSSVLIYRARPQARTMEQIS